MKPIAIIGIFLALGTFDNLYINAVGIAMIALTLPTLREMT